MTSNKQILTVFIPEKFDPVLTRFFDLMDEDQDFQDSMKSRVTNKGMKDKRYKKTNQNAAKVRFSIALYVKNNVLRSTEKKRAEIFNKNKQEELDGETEINDNQESDLGQ